MRRRNSPPGSLEIEMTETALMGTSSGRDNVVERLRGRGLRIALDDFGTGYSSLLYLRRFPVDRIKIAQEFVKDIGIEPNDTAIVKAAIGLARELGIGVMAEGVETAEQVQLLHEWGCRQAQGFYFAAPILAEDVLPLLRAGSVMRWRAVASDALNRPRRLEVVKPNRVHPAPKSGGLSGRRVAARAGHRVAAARGPKRRRSSLTVVRFGSSRGDADGDGARFGCEEVAAAPSRRAGCCRPAARGCNSNSIQREQGANAGPGCRNAGRGYRERSASAEAARQPEDSAALSPAGRANTPSRQSTAADRKVHRPVAHRRDADLRQSARSRCGRNRL